MNKDIYTEVSGMVIGIIGENGGVAISFHYLEVDDNVYGRAYVTSLYTNSGNVYYHYTDTNNRSGVRCLGTLTDNSLARIKEAIRDNAFTLQDKHGNRYKPIRTNDAA